MKSTKKPLLSHPKKSLTYAGPIIAQNNKADSPVKNKKMKKQSHTVAATPEKIRFAETEQNK
jgi:hypothetical protein